MNLNLKLADLVIDANISPSDLPATVMRKLQAVIDKQAPEPVDMILHCPTCLHQHIDRDEGQHVAPHTSPALWRNPPHRSHLCGNCGFVWRPADVPTNGVETIKTRGKNDMVLIDGPAVELERLRRLDGPQLDWPDTEPQP